MAQRMKQISTTFVTALLVAVAMITAQVDGARAQNPELGDESDVGMGAGGGAAAGASWSTGTQASGDVSATGTAAAPTYEEEPSDPPSYSSSSGDSDHSAMVGNFGVGFFGVLGVPIALAPTPAQMADPAAFAEYVHAPTIGLRYWLSDLLAIEGALGIGIYSGSGEDVGPPPVGGTTVVDPPSATAFALHGAVPLALAHSGHFVFEVVPELNFGFSTGTVYSPLPPGGAATDVDVGGLLFQLGARVGAEIHFGFIDIPQLALQGTIGLHLTYESRSADFADGSSSSRSEFVLATSWNEDPWELFTGNIAAIYYFP